MRSIVFLATFAILAPLTASQTQTKTCGDWTALQPVMIGAGETKCYTTTKEIKFTCSRLYIDNSDYPPLCKDGDIFTTKADGRVKRFCGKQKNQLTDFLPAYSKRVLKAWFIPNENHKEFNSKPINCCATCSMV